MYLLCISSVNPLHFLQYGQHFLASAEGHIKVPASSIPVEAVLGEDQAEPHRHCDSLGNMYRHQGN